MMTTQSKNHCPTCKKDWNPISEQGVCVDLYGECFVCFIQVTNPSTELIRTVQEEANKRGAYDGSIQEELKETI